MMMKMMPVKKKNERVKQFAAPTFKLIKQQQQMGPRLLRAIYRFVDTVRGKDGKKEQHISRV